MSDMLASCRYFTNSNDDSSGSSFQARLKFLNRDKLKHIGHFVSNGTYVFFGSGFSPTCGEFGPIKISCI